MSDSPLITISIPTYNRASNVIELLENICSQLKADGIEGAYAVHVNDNCSTDDTLERVKAYAAAHPQVRITWAKNPSNLGFDRNCDLAARAPKTVWTWLFGDDDLFTEGSLKFMFDNVMALPPDISFATALVNVYDSKLEGQLMDFSKEYAGDRIFQGVSAESAKFYNKYHFIGNHLFKTEKWAQTENIEKYMTSAIVQLYFILFWVGKGEKIAFFNQVCIRARYNNSSHNEDVNFNIFSGCLDYRSQMVYDAFQDRTEQKMLLDAFFQPYVILSFKKTEKANLLPSQRDYALYKVAMKHYSYSPKAWLIYTGELFIPPQIARAMKSAMDVYRSAKHARKASA